MTKKQQAKAEELTTITVYRVKKSGWSNGVFYKAGSVVKVVENAQGERYTVTLRPRKSSCDHPHTCTCIASAVYKRQCYHILRCAAIENERTAVRALVNGMAGLADVYHQRIEEAQAELEAIELASTLSSNRPFELIAA